MTDEQKGVLPGVAIIVTHAESGTVRETITGADGTFLVPGLIPGPYTVTAELSGFSRLRQEELVLRIGATLQLDLVLKVGAVEESLTVTAEAPQVDLTSAQVGGSVTHGRDHQPAVGHAQLHRPRGAPAGRRLQRGRRLIVRQRDDQRPERAAASSS